VRKPLVGRVALAGRIIERTGAAAALDRETRAAGMHRRGARAPRFAISHLSCSPPWSAARSTLRWRRRRGQWTIRRC